MKRILQAVDYVSRHPGCNILSVARAVGPNGSVRYGYRSVHRAIARGLIKASKTRTEYKLEVTTP